MIGAEVREAARETALQTRAEQGLPPHVTDPVTIRRLVTLIEVRPAVAAGTGRRPRKRAA